MNTAAQIKQLTEFHFACRQAVAAYAAYYAKRTSLAKWCSEFIRAVRTTETRDQLRVLMNAAPPPGTAAFGLAIQKLQEMA